MIADSIRRELLERGAKTVQTAGWFMMKKNFWQTEICLFVTRMTT